MEDTITLNRTSLDLEYEKVALNHPVYLLVLHGFYSVNIPPTPAISKEHLCSDLL